MATGWAAPAGGDPLARALARAHGVLPDQGPIAVFVHHNTLHAFQHLPFHEGVRAGAAELGARPYLDLDEFRALLAAGRVSRDDLATEVDRRLGDRGRAPVCRGLTRRNLWLTLLTADCHVTDEAGFSYLLGQGQAPVCADLPLFQACEGRLATAAPLLGGEPPHPRRHRDVLLALGAGDPDAAVHPDLIRLAARFLDHGHALLPMPGREGGFLAAVLTHYTDVAPPAGCEALRDDVLAHDRARTPAREIILDVLHSLGVAGAAIEDFVLATSLALPGWAGMFARLERHPEESPDGHGRPALEEFLAVRLLLERRAVESVCANAGLPVAWERLARQHPAAAQRPPRLDAQWLWWVARTAGLSPQDVEALPDADLAGLRAEAAAATPVALRALFHEAFERHYREAILDALAAARPATLAHRPDARAQFVFCIDEREESIRRAIEEQGPAWATYGVAGFFGLAIDYQGLDDAVATAHCPVAVTPAHEVQERPTPRSEARHHARRAVVDAWHRWEHRLGTAARTAAGGLWTSLLAGPVLGAGLMLHVAMPRVARASGQRLEAHVAALPETRLSALRNGDVIPAGRKPVGFTVDEAADRIAATLTNIGLTSGFAPLVVLVGHGSTSLNNPHESAHDCGACGGRRGGANARLFAQFANMPDVRAAVRARGVAIPEGTWFIGGLHDTAHDGVTFYELGEVPGTHAAALDEARHVLDVARQASAQERCRRFEATSLSVSPEEALAHVEGRAASLGQPRPEYGHCTNAMAVVGRRALTRALHLDRRAFLVSYDPDGDPAGAILERILAAVGPVGAGISLEYYFSSVDNETFGCGTKLPHNVTGLVGVMNGHQSDLRTGLPLQMVEIHEPMRLLLMVEAAEATLLAIAARQPEVAELVGNAWVQLVAIDPRTGAQSVFLDGGFVPYRPRPVNLPVVERSADWHMRSRDHLGPALVTRAQALHG